MCGIVGYIGPRNAAQVLFEGLKRLEYRGYDSAGMAVHDGSRLVLVRAVGKLDNLVKAVDAKPLSGNLGVGHTRWATHGRPSETNAHPHLAGDVALVHNGIIENHLELKRELEAQGVRFLSDTDTEIAAQLVARAFEHSGCLLSAVRSALRQIRGAYALAVTSAREPGRLIIAKQASPLVVGIADGETLCASDVPALLGYTRHVVFLEDGELAELRADQVRIENLDGQVVVREPRRIDWSPVQAEKGGFKHFMLKEIFEQPRAIEDTLRGRVELEKAEIVASDFGLAPEVTSQIERVVLLACGTSYHAALAGRYWLEQIACIPAHAELASEVRYRNPVFGPRDLVIGISQSGETADTLAALKAAGEAGASLLALANVLDSAIPRYA